MICGDQVVKLNLSLNERLPFSPRSIRKVDVELYTTTKVFMTFAKSPEKTCIDTADIDDILTNDLGRKGP